MKGYHLEAETKSKRPTPRNRTDLQPTVQGTRKRKMSSHELPEHDTASVSGKRQATGNEGDDNSFITDIGWNKQVIDDVYCSAPESTNSEETPVIEVAGASNLYQEKNCQTPRMYPELEKRRYFI